MHDRHCSARLRPAGSLFAAGLVALSLLAGCSGGSTDAGPPGSGSFVLEGTNVSAGAVWPLNQVIELRFNQAVDLSTASLNTVRITADSDAAVSGSFSFLVNADGSLDSSVLAFHPACPVLADLSDAGLQPGSTRYTLQVLGASDGAGTLLSAAGQALEVGTTVVFETPQGPDSADLFVDSLAGPPRARLRGRDGVGADEANATYVEIGGDPDQRAYFEFDPSTGAGVIDGFTAPLNFYSDPATQLAVLVHLDQPLAPAAGNAGPERFRLEWRLGQGDQAWASFGSAVRLEANCSAAGAIVRIEPQGVLPAGAQLRLVVGAGLADLVGELSLEADGGLGLFEADSLPPGSSSADEVLERFTAGADAAGSNEDPAAVGGLPRANWGAGKLEAGTGFEGSGGPGGEFDLVLSAGQLMIVATDYAQVTGGPDGAPTMVQEVVGGVLDVRDLRLAASSQLIFVGPNPARILAAGEVTIAGEISIRGGNNPGVGGLNSPAVPEPGAVGNGGGGAGGIASGLTDQSTPRGGAGQGPYGAPDRGGEGGETGYGLFTESDRRGAGGGGGRLGRDVFYDHDEDPATPDVHVQTLIGLDAESGRGGTATGLGAVSQAERPTGGQVGPLPFTDDNPGNDFFGTLVTAQGATISGEASEILAGAGGGGGGDAVRSESFPLVPFTSIGDEKGGGGGGGGGGISIVALGPILVEAGGAIRADGGFGGAGESTFNSARVSGAGGGGSGGHIVLASAAFVEVRGEAIFAGDGYGDDPTLEQHYLRPLSALGGQGGGGEGTSSGGATSGAQTPWRRDAIPRERIDLPTELGGPVPPFGHSYPFQSVTDPLGPALGAGGDGGPGLLQLHVDDPALNLRFTASGISGAYGTPGGADVTRACAPTPLGWNGTDQPSDNLLPIVGRRSASLSDWIPLGLPSLDADGQVQPLAFLFDGIDPSTGAILAEGGAVTSLPVVAGPTPVGDGQADVRLQPGGLGVDFAAGDLKLLYRNSPQLLVGFDLVLATAGTDQQAAKFEVQAVEADSLENRIALFVAPADSTPGGYVAQATAPVSASIEPRFFRVATGGQAATLSAGSSVSIAFDAARSAADNQPDVASSFSATNGNQFTSDLEDLSVDPWTWVRFRVTFDLGADPLSLESDRPALTLLRLPFLF